MKTLILTLLLALLAGLEYGHALSQSHAPGANLCIPAEGKSEAVRDALFAHFRSH